MRRHRPALPLLLAGLLLAVSCARTQTMTYVSSLEPAPFLELLERRTAAIAGLSAEMEMDFRDNERRFRGRAYLMLAADGRFRIEVPGPWGSTALVMVSDGEDLWAYYPEKNRAYRSALDGRSLSPYLPFPFEMDLRRLPAALAGVLPADRAWSGPRAFLLSSGQAALLLDLGGREGRYTFSGGLAGELARLEVPGGQGSLMVDFAGQSPSLPHLFEYRASGALLKGRLEDVRVVADPPERSFLPPQPSDMPVLDLEAGT